MLIIGCDYHPGFQQIAFVDTETGEFGERRLTHREEAEQFYGTLQERSVRVGMEASGHARWFERLLKGLQFELCAFYPASDWKHGVAVLRSGEVDAWDVSKGQKQSELDLQGDLQDVSFSEDDSRFAASSVRFNEDSSSTLHLLVWDTNPGQFLREMIPPYYFENDEIGRPMWWGHGKYLLADVRAGHWGGYIVAIWNVESGQLRAGFSGCDHSEDPYAVGIDGTRLLKWCRDNTLLVWDIPTAVKKVAEFEGSLNSNR